jgi:hypothetical protein
MLNPIARNTALAFGNPPFPPEKNFLRNANGTCPDGFKLRFKRLKLLIRTG